uniref:Uncharacterized protein n=1 Tax=Timema cristinae TaxID=61476 RepID=A0A7R9D367_TIMCR|nr:unnamed protein product [Timema cristinae]
MTKRGRRELRGRDSDHRWGGGRMSVDVRAEEGRHVEGVWHTGIVAYGREYFFGMVGVQSCNPNYRDQLLTKILCPTPVGVTEHGHNLTFDYVTYFQVDHNLSWAIHRKETKHVGRRVISRLLVAAACTCGALRRVLFYIFPVFPSELVRMRSPACIHHMSKGNKRGGSFFHSFPHRSFPYLMEPRLFLALRVARSAIICRRGARSLFATRCRLSFFLDLVAGDIRLRTLATSDVTAGQDRISHTRAATFPFKQLLICAHKSELSPFQKTWKHRGCNQGPLDL